MKRKLDPQRSSGRPSSSDEDYGIEIAIDGMKDFCLSLLVPLCARFLLGQVSDSDCLFSPTCFLRGIFVMFISIATFAFDRWTLFDDDITSTHERFQCHLNFVVILFIGKFLPKPISDIYKPTGWESDILRNSVILDDILAVVLIKAFLWFYQARSGEAIIVNQKRPQQIHTKNVKQISSIIVKNLKKTHNIPSYAEYKKSAIRNAKGEDDCENKANPSISKSKPRNVTSQRSKESKKDRRLIIGDGPLLRIRGEY